MMKINQWEKWDRFIFVQQLPASESAHAMLPPGGNLNTDFNCRRCFWCELGVNDLLSLRVNV